MCSVHGGGHVKQAQFYYLALTFSASKCHITSWLPHDITSKEVAEATAQRKEENAAFQEMMASDSAAKELLGIAKNRLLGKFHLPPASPTYVIKARLLKEPCVFEIIHNLIRAR